MSERGKAGVSDEANSPEIRIWIATDTQKRSGDQCENVASSATATTMAR